jgi:hypothetical protein
VRYSESFGSLPSLSFPRERAAQRTTMRALLDTMIFDEIVADKALRCDVLKLKHFPIKVVHSLRA